MSSSNSKCLSSQSDRQSDFSHIGAWLTPTTVSVAPVPIPTLLESPKIRPDGVIFMPYPNHLEDEVLLSPNLLQRQSLHAISNQAEAEEVIEDRECNTWTSLNTGGLNSGKKTFLMPDNYSTTLLAAEYGESHLVSDTSLPASHYQHTHTEHQPSDNWSLCLSTNIFRSTNDCDEAPNDSSTHPDEEQYFSPESTFPSPLGQATSQERSISAHLCCTQRTILPRFSAQLAMPEPKFVVGHVDEQGWNHIRREEERIGRQKEEEEQEEVVLVVDRRRSK